jgi:hypothetical protein
MAKHVRPISSGSRWVLVRFALVLFLLYSLDMQLPVKQRNDHDATISTDLLCPECLEIVERAEAIDLQFVDVSNGHVDHPHMGALDESGTRGYVPDPTALRRKPPPFTVSGSELETICNTQDAESRMITEKVRVKNPEKRELPNNVGQDGLKILCVITSISTTHHKIPIILQTWGYVV